MAQIAFLTLYLGLISGKQPINLRVDPAIAMVRMTLDGKQVAVLTQPPWRATVDFGQGIAPQELVAVGFDKDGAEVARATQAINIPRPIAEADMMVTGQTVELTWRHRMNEKPSSVLLQLDDKPLVLKDYRAVLPKVNMDTPHVLAATFKFRDGSARVERVLGGTLPDTTGTELTPTAVHQTGHVPASLEGCFTTGGTSLTVRAVEKSDALVILVRNPNPASSLIAMGEDPNARVAIIGRHNYELTSLGAATRVRIVWPIAETYSGTDLPTSQLFPFSGDFDSQSGGMLAHMVLERGDASHAGVSHGRSMRLADATAVAGVQAADGGRRRAVVVVLDGVIDDSRYDPVVVRRYLASIGVPLFVWSVIGPQPYLEAKWGPILDVSYLDKLFKATDILKRELESQQIVWLEADPIRTMHASLKPSCGLTMLSRP